jgi:hypothetical protein
MLSIAIRRFMLIATVPEKAVGQAQCPQNGINEGTAEAMALNHADFLGFTGDPSGDPTVETSDLETIADISDDQTINFGSVAESDDCAWWVQLSGQVPMSEIVGSRYPQATTGAQTPTPTPAYFNTLGLTLRYEDGFVLQEVFRGSEPTGTPVATNTSGPSPTIPPTYTLPPEPPTPTP